MAGGRFADARGRGPLCTYGKLNHNGRQAMDLSISGYAGKKVVDGDGEEQSLKKWKDVEDLGASY